MKYLAVKNFERFQHYKNAADAARPAWIKLYASLLYDFEFADLPDDAKGHLIMIWLLVSQRSDKRIPYDAKAIGRCIGSKSKIDLDLLVTAGFLVALDPIGETALEPNDQTALEQNREEEKRREYRPTDSGSQATLIAPALSLAVESNGKSHSAADALAPSDLVEAWNAQMVPLGLSAVEELSATRSQKCRLRLREHPKVEWWESFFSRLRASPLCLGLVPPKVAGQKPWRADFDWMIDNDINALKVVEGRYLAK